uniref:C2H2-type domain-containing protein n=2 Tax=Lepeophtheirus salmonis TaxID=72036 RepID=A0A0K2T7V1_LEPSM
MDLDRNKITILQCSKCKLSFNDMKSLQMHNYMEHQNNIIDRHHNPPPLSNPTMVVIPHIPYHAHSQNNVPLSPPKRVFEHRPIVTHRIPHAISSSSAAAVAAAAAQAAAASSNVPPRVSSFSNSYSQRDDKTFDCELCGISIVGSNTFSQHLMSHASPRPYVCPDCDAGFPSTRQLEAHMQLHAKK